MRCWNTSLLCRSMAVALTAAVMVLLPCISRAQPLTVFAAASLKESLDGAAKQFARAQGVTPVISYLASSALAQQIERGAPADVFISADLEWMDYLDQRALLRAGTRANLLHNRLVLIAPADSKLQVEIKAGMPLASWLGDGRLSMADPDSVPAGKYARAALQSLGVWKSVETKVVRGDNVRTALNFVARGETPLGIVYQTDASAEKRVRTVAVFPQNSYPVIVYPAAVVAASRNAAAQSFLNYLKSTEARAIFEKYGFTIDR